MIQYRAVITAIAASLVLLSSSASAEPVTAGDGYSPLFRQMFAAVLEETSLETDVMTAPPERRRRLFALGRIVLDCCSIEAWRQREEEIAVQLFSVPFFTNRDRFVVRENSSIVITGPEDLKNLRVAVVHGFEYDLSSHFGVTVPGRGWDAMLQLIEKGRADIGIIGEVIFKERQMNDRRALKLVGVADEQDLSIRIHNSRPDLVPIINEAILNLRERGVFKDIINAVPD